MSESSVFIGTLRRRLFIPVDHEWNGVVRDITATFEHEEMVDPARVEAEIAKFYRNRATLALFRMNLHGDL